MLFGGWKHFGITDVDGEAKNELLPRKYTFRMIYDGAGISKKQDVSVDSAVIFSTINVTVKLQNSTGGPIAGGNVSFYNQYSHDDTVEPIYPTPTIGMLGILEDKNNQMTISFKNKGNIIFLIVASKNDIASSEYLI